MKFFHPSIRLTNQKPRAFVSVPQTNQIALFPFVSRSYEDCSIEWFRVNVVFAQIFQPVENSTGTVWT